jgi:glyoxylase-like metal-dependent hydrolase (beta-lactamase superfamily II)
MFNPILIEARNPSPMTGRGNNTYLVAGANGAATLIDAGVGEPPHLAEIDQQLAAHRARLDRVLVTHGHADHASGAPVLASAHAHAAFAKYPWPEEDARYQVPWQALADGDVVAAGAAGAAEDESLIVLHTPGHSPDHVAFWHEPTRTAFTGDLVVAGSSVMIHSSRGGNLADYLAALERLLALAPRTLLPAHGPRVDDPEALITLYLEHRRMRERQVIAALLAGHATVQAIAESIYDGLAPALMAAARENVRAHLQKLKAEGRAIDEAGRWTM